MNKDGNFEKLTHFWHDNTYTLLAW